MRSAPISSTAPGCGSLLCFAEAGKDLADATAQLAAGQPQTNTNSADLAVTKRRSLRLRAGPR